MPNITPPLANSSLAYTDEYENIDKTTKIKTIIQTIEKNSRLTQEEKKFFLSSPELFEDNINYLNCSITTDYLENLQIEYIASPSPDGKQASFTYAGPNKGLLKVYNSTSFADAPKWAMSHEFVHVFTSYENFAYGLGFYEIINTIMNNEYFGKHNTSEDQIYDSGYTWLRGYAYVFCSLLEEEDLRNYHATANPDIIVDALTKIIFDKEKAIKVLTDFDFLIDNIATKPDLSGIYVPESVIDQFGQKRNALKNAALEYYEAKFHRTIENDLFLQYWFNLNLLYQNIADTYSLNPAAVRFLPEYTKIKNYQTYFNKGRTETDDMTILICDMVGLDREFYTKEELLEKGYSEEEISHLYIIEDGRYDFRTYYPKNYIECPLFLSKSNNRTIA